MLKGVLESFELDHHENQSYSSHHLTVKLLSYYCVLFCFLQIFPKAPYKVEGGLHLKAQTNDRLHVATGPDYTAVWRY